MSRFTQPLWVIPAEHGPNYAGVTRRITPDSQPRPQGLLAFEYGGDRREDPGRPVAGGGAGGARAPPEIFRLELNSATTVEFFY